ncbi:erythronolide synthase [Micromonospora craterilacus]|uniref:Erythronolide synthase n=1 Tax=Micromonospora craterilacus TaxID=1655439 RepID=A0A2W2FR80_9ACTN|nr:type I polyketide synthase [Micromonospora craterilacus]PZG24357.1 erythronolide synthase [Micromonospora craterilacus]
MSRIAVVGLACRFPDAAGPGQLWENALAGRRAFRRLPDERMRAEDYWSADPTAPDRYYAGNAAVIEGYEFDRVGFKVSGSTYRSTDLTHWLALDMAAQALADAGFADGDGLPRERTAVVVGNTLTGEFTRAGTMRLRWPYVRRVVGAALGEQGWDDEKVAGFLAGLETSYKSPFPEVTEDTLAGGLSNTIAGRICNHFDLHGGGYTVDGACSSSLLSVLTACRNLTDLDADVAVAGGVDLSIDPFEMVGFARTGALAREEMRVYDRRSNGFWPGEGCGMVVLMRERDALAQGRRIYATIAGWGVSSDGRGGITRPEANGYRLALRRAYQRAGFGVDTVPLFEGHGTGTAVGDATELTALGAERRAVNPDADSAAIGSIKGMIGHTKAAAGVAGLIKAVLAVHHQVIPPTVGCVDPHLELTGDRPALRVVRQAEPWPAGAPQRAGVTAMGFGGINTHLVVDGPVRPRRRALDRRTRQLARSVQDAELLLFDADTPDALRDRLEALRPVVAALAFAELADLATTLYRAQRGRGYRAAVVARSPQEAERALGTAAAALTPGGPGALVDAARGVFVGRATRPVRIGFLFPGQGSGQGWGGGALGRRFTEVDDAWRAAGDLPVGDRAATASAQPRIVTGSVAALRVLGALDIDATVSVGHSLGELTALHWAGCLDEDELRELVAARGEIMATRARPGAMAGVTGDPDETAALLAGTGAVIAGYNGPRQTVVAGADDAVGEVARRAGLAGLVCTRLNVSHAFHSPLMAPAAAAFGERLRACRFGPPLRRVASTVTGAVLPPDTDLAGLLHRQIEAPVRFTSALACAAAEVDLFVEVGPGQVLTRLARDQVPDLPALALDTDAESLAGLLATVGAVYALGGPAAYPALFEDRLTRPFDPQRPRTFFASPCESAPQVAAAVAAEPVAATPADDVALPAGTGALELVRQLVAQRAELPVEVLDDDSRLLDDLHMSSITVGQLVNEAARAMGLSAVAVPTNFATATVREMAEALQAREHEGSPERPDLVAGVAPWVRTFVVDLVDEPLPLAEPAGGPGRWEVFASPGHPLADPLRRVLAEAGLGGGVLVCLPDDSDDAHLGIAVRGAQAALRQPAGGRLVLVQPAARGGALAKTARLEGDRLRTTVVTTPLGPAAVARVLAEVAATTDFTEVTYDATGVRRVPVLRPLPVDPRPGPVPLGPDDVLLVTGGGKGITAESAAMLAGESGARLAVVGRSDPATDEALAANLSRLREAAGDLRYLRVDVTDAAAVAAAVADLTAGWGPVTAVLHGAGLNTPAALGDLDEAAVRAVFAPKVGGLRTVLAAVDPARLRLLVTFGSIIGRAGLHGEAHYAAANEALAELTREVAATHPECRAVCLEWSVWSGVGMGERLSVVETLSGTGVTPISPDDGLRVLREVVADDTLPPVVVVTGRTGGLETLRYHQPDLPLLRFTERPLVRYDGVELVCEVDLTPTTDPYLADHRLDGDLLFPAVLGLEAMAQVATALARHRGVPVIEDVRFDRPVVVDPEAGVTVRVAALVRSEQVIDVVIRSAATGFAADHFRARLRFAPDATYEVDTDAPDPAELPALPLDPARDLYGDVLFQAGRFRRLRGYRHAAARVAEAEVVTSDAGEWFSPFLPGRLVLGDPGARDAFMHGIQVCVPDATLLPEGIDRIWSAGPKLSAAETVTMTAWEREQHGTGYVYDVVVRDGAGTVIEHWTGLRLRAVRPHTPSAGWPAVLLGPLLQRRLADVFTGDVAVAAAPGGGPRDAGGLLSRAVGRPVVVRHRPDGRPEVDLPCAVSVAHSASLHLAVAGDGPLACDVEPVTVRPADVRRGLIGRHGPLAALLVAEVGDTPDLAATRVWCATECLQKAGRTDGPLTLVPGAVPDGWVVLDSGGVRIATRVVTVADTAERVVVAVLAGTGR